MKVHKKQTAEWWIAQINKLLADHSASLEAWEEAQRCKSPPNY